MTTATVAVFDDERLIREGEAAVDLYNRDLKNARARIMPMALGLVAAKRKYPATHDFGDWLQTSSYREIGDTDRAALINIGEHDEFSAKYVRTTSLISPQTIWNAIKELMPTFYDRNSTDQDPVESESDATASTAASASDSDSADSSEKTGPDKSRRSHGVVGSGTKRVNDASKLELVKLLDVAPDDLYEFLDAYPVHRQRVIKAEFGALAKGKWKRCKKPSAIRLFQLGVAVARAGKAPLLSNVQAPLDVRIFFPDLPEAFCKHMTLLNAIEQHDRLILVNERAAELAANNTSMAVVFKELAHLLQTGKTLPPPPPVQFPANSRIKHEVKYCGEVIWPGKGLDDLSYEDLRAGWHLADHWLKTLEVATPKKPNEVLTELNHLVQDIRAASSLDGLCRVMTACTAAYAKRNNRQNSADFSGGMPPGFPR